ncbi:hypothetical protein F5Y19DRAFT_413869 [Xylariaceae sp. FL1651]|nr:hypothetical protein F5Y19DRAFT_413869 [Xylariaceae sp. FL1651]
MQATVLHAVCALSLFLSMASAREGFISQPVPLANGSIGTAYFRNSTSPSPKFLHSARNTQAIIQFTPGTQLTYKCHLSSIYTQPCGPPLSDCSALGAALHATPGFWKVKRWMERQFEELASYGSCRFYVARARSINSSTIGNGDVYTALTASVGDYTTGRSTGAGGMLLCDNVNEIDFGI